MPADLKLYAGREQAWVKHYFLENYLERLIHKTASRYDEIAYVDGFSGPWQSTGEDFADTSFGIALAALRRAKASWKAHGREVRMTVHLVEKAARPFVELQSVPPRYPDIEFKLYNADFVAASSAIFRSIPNKAFAFLFLDPKGWRIDIAALAALLARPNSEVVFNFMFEFINRAASMADPRIVSGLDALIPHGDWRRRLSHGPTPGSNFSGQQARKTILIEAFSETLARVGGYSYVAETPILRPLKNRTLYALVYGTRKSIGIEVFRDCQVKTLEEQAAVRGATKHAHVQAQSGQTEMFGATVPVAPDETRAFLDQERDAGEHLLLRSIPALPNYRTYGGAWPLVLAKHAIRKVELDAFAARMRLEGTLVFPDWEPRKRKPKDNYRVAKAAAES